MRSRALAAVLACAGLVTAGGVFAAPRTASLHGDRAKAPERFLVRGLDRDAVSLTLPATGETWSAWAYRSGPEFDVAVSRLDGTGSWSEPEFFGRFDGRDQVSPSLAADGAGNLYLVYAVEPTGEIRLAIRPFGASAWIAPVTIGARDQKASDPTARVVGDRLVVAFRTADGIGIVDLALYRAGPASVRGVQDGPDGFPPNGSRPKTEPTPASGGLR